MDLGMIILSRDDIVRPVEIELIEVFNQQKDIQVTVTEAINILLAKGHKHTQQAVRDNMMILVEAGFLTYGPVECKFSRSPNAEKADLTKRTLIKLPSRAHKQYERNQRPPSDHCNKCGKEFTSRR